MTEGTNQIVLLPPPYVSPLKQQQQQLPQIHNSGTFNHPPPPQSWNLGELERQQRVIHPQQTLPQSHYNQKALRASKCGYNNIKKQPPPPSSSKQLHNPQACSQQHIHPQLYPQGQQREIQQYKIPQALQQEIERKCVQYDEAKKWTFTNIKKNIDTAIEKLKDVEKEILKEAEIELNENPFSTLLTKICSGSIRTEAEVMYFLSKEIPRDFGPDKESFRNLLGEIESLKSWRLKKKRNETKNVLKMGEFAGCTWVECFGNIFDWRRYSVKRNNPRIATKTGDSDSYCTIIGDTAIPLNKVTSWNIKILKSEYNDGGGIDIGVAPFDIDQNGDNYNKYGWFCHCYDSSLWSGPPHNYQKKGYGLMNLWEQYIHTGSNIGVVMNTTKGELSFILGGVNLGVAYERIPLDKPLVPCVLLKNEGDSVELDTSEMKENVDNFIPIPSNITTKSDTCDSITLTWDTVDEAPFYQIKIDESIYMTVTNTFIKNELVPDTKYSFRVRAIRDNGVSKWSKSIERKTAQKLFENSRWKECPYCVDEKKQYCVDMNNPRITTKISTSHNWSTIMGNTPLPPNNVTSWNIKILKSENNNGFGVLIGVAPFDIDQNDDNNYVKYGWYFCCHESMLYSGLPHNYEAKEYGPKREKGGYIHSGDSVGVMIDAFKGNLSFVLSGVNFGVAYEEIPLDKPLFPCILLYIEGDSVELDTSEVKENEIDISIPIPFNVIVKSITWDSITLTWNKVERAEFYQIEVNGNNLLDATTTNVFTKVRLPAETEYGFRVRTVRDNKVGEWSVVVKGITKKQTGFSESVWKECPDYVKRKMKYFVDKNNLKIATKVGFDCYTTIIGNTPLPHNRVTSWNVKILKSLDNNGDGIWVGVAPIDINQNEDCNPIKYGWYFNCFVSTLWSGPPHNLLGTVYEQRKEEGEYVHTGDSIGVVMDTTNDELSFVLNEVNRGVAYKGIPLDKPLVPCVILWNEGDSVELDTSEVKKNEIDISISVPSNITAKSNTWDSITLSWDAVEGASFYQIEVDDLKLWESSTTNLFTERNFFPETEHSFKVRTVRETSVSEWSNVIRKKVQTKSFESSRWKDCPIEVNALKMYYIDEKNLKVAEKKLYSTNYCTIIGNTPLPLNKVTSWNIKVLKSKENNGNCINIGIAPFDINQNEDNYDNCGWYFYCYYSTLWSGPPHNYTSKEYGLRKRDGEYVHTGDSVGVVIDATKGELSFVLNEVNLGVAFEGIPLDKPLVPCVLLREKGDSVEFDTTEVKENLDNLISIPFNVTTKSITWDSITLTWDVVDGASFYQVEVDGSKLFEASPIGQFTKTGLLPNTWHDFRVRTVKNNSVSEWSVIVKGVSQKESFETSRWGKCPDYVNGERRYLIDLNNSRIAMSLVGGWINSECTIIGNTPLPLNKVTSWSIKVLKSRNNDGNDIYVGVAPSDINQNEDKNYNKCGWYFHCYNSILYSGPPHNYNDGIEYGPRKEKSGEYVHTGDKVGVIMDTLKGELSFVIDRINYGVAFKRIPLNKPLVPCIILYYKDDSIELDTSEVKDIKVDNSIPVPPNVMISTIMLDSITLTWDVIEEASFYQIEVDGNKFLNTITTNIFTKCLLIPDTEHTFRVRTVSGEKASEWSDVVKGITQKQSFEISQWEKCPNYVDRKRKYFVDVNNSRIAISTCNDGSYCTIIGNTHIPLNKVSSWNIKILKSKKSDGDCINIGVAPFDINQNEEDNYNKCGWFCHYYNSSLWSGPPHYYDGKGYGLVNQWEYYVHTGESVGVVMDTMNGELSFVLNGVDFGIAFEGIPLDKPLVPCVLLRYEGESVELDLSEVKQDEVDRSIPVPSKIKTKSITWNSITLTWKNVEGASFYQVDADGNELCTIPKANTFTLMGLLANTDHAFRMRTVKGNKVSEWSEIVKGRSLKKSFKSSGWKECPDYVFGKMMYFVDENNPRIVTKIGKYSWSTIIGNTPLPSNKVTSWNIKVLESENNDGFYIDIGTAPFDISQDNEDNYKEYGWYFSCYDSKLFSGPPHNYMKESYGVRKKWGDYVHTGDSIGVVMNTTKGELSFIVNGVNIGIAYKKIPLDKPLVPCVLLGIEGDSVELVI